MRGGVPGPVSRALTARLRAVESRNVTFAGEGWPVFWERARGANVEDADGNIYLDLTGAFGVALVGHGHPRVVAAVEAQVRRLIHGMGDVHPPAVKVELLERLARCAPWPESRAVLSSTGSEAVETALKTAQLATGRPGLVAFEGGYHGLTLGALSATARPLFRTPFAERVYPGVALCPFPDRRRGTGGVEEALACVAGALESGAPNGDPVGAVLVEPVQGRGGARVPPDGFMAALSRLAHEAGALVIADEVLTGMGRCGAALASGRVGLEPDLVCVGKALGGGMPISACLGAGHVMDAWPPSEGEAIHTSTFLGHPLSAAAACAVLDALESEAVPERADGLGAELVERLGGALEGAPGVADVRGLGLLLGVELAADGPGGAPQHGRAARVAEAALQRGLMVLPAGDHGHVLELTPPVSLTDEQLAWSVETLAQVVEDTP